VTDAARDYDGFDPYPEPPGLGEVLTIPQVAKQAKWTTARMRRYLYAKNAELDGSLLHNVGRGKERPRWTVTLAAVRAIAPQWFHDPESLQKQLDWMKVGQDDLRVHFIHMTKRIDQIVEHIALMNRDQNASRQTPTARRGSS
jgi:hypothetical protein